MPKPLSLPPCVSDSVAWHWAIAFICFAVRIEIRDWWHAAYAR